MLDKETKQQIATEYIEKLNIKTRESAKEKDLLKNLNPKEEDLKDFLVEENIIDTFKDSFLLKTKISLSFLQENILKKLEEARKIINSYENEDDIRKELWLLPNKEQSWEIEKNNEEEKYYNIENLKPEDLLYINEIKENQKQFWIKIIKISQNLWINPNRLMAVMKSESWLNHKIQNPNWNATWLIQFMPNTAKWLWTTINELKNMTNLKQLDYVEKYYLPYKDKIKSFRDLYLVTFYPLAVWKEENFIIWSEKSESYAKRVWKDNQAINEWKPISVWDFENWVLKKIPSNIRDQFQS